jgi:hypothetical protein
VRQTESGSYVDHATDNVKDSVSTSTQKGGHALKNQVQRSFQKFREGGKTDSSVERSDASGSKKAGWNPESTAQRTGLETARAQSKQAAEKATEQTTQNMVIRPAGDTVRQGAKAAETTGTTIKQSTRGTVKTLQRSVKSAENAARASIKTSQAAANTAVKTAKASKLAVQAARANAKIVAATARITARAIVASVKAAIAAIKGIVSLIAAGGWVAVVIILIIMLAAMLICSPFGAFLNGGGDGTPTLSSVIQTIDSEFDQ